MTAAEFREAQETLGLTDDQLAAEYGVTPDIVRAWAAANVAIPKRHAQQLAWDAAVAKRDRAFQAAGLPECDWMVEHMKAGPTSAKQVEAHYRAVEQHVGSCELCIARGRFEEENLDPLPDPPVPGWMTALGWIERVPAWARPAVVGALILAALVSLRIVFALPRIVRTPSFLGELLLAVVAAAGAGAAGGLAYSLTRPTLKKLGAVGAYLTGIVCVFAYMGALALVAPVAFGEPIIEDRAGVVIFAIVSLFFGLVMGHSWFRDPDLM